jgi:4-amino-4-deoxy-L-arabinose transferase-like glycosyltransferase
MAAVVAIWAAFQDLHRLAQPFVLFDERTYANAAWRYIHLNVLAPAHDANPLHATQDNFEHPPLAKWLFGLMQLVAGHPSVTADRLVAALCTLVTAIVLGVWVGRAAGRWTGLLAGAFFALLPEAVNGADARFGRFGMLEPVAGLFMVGSLALAWVWSRRIGPPAWRYAVLTGVAVGCAASAKESGFLGAVGPVLLLIGLAARDRQLLVARLTQALTAAVVSAGALLASYLPLGHPLARVGYLLRHGSAHTSKGHLVGFAGQVSAKPPWWTNLWYAGHGLGAVLMSVLLLCALSAVVLRRDALVGWLAASLVAPLVFHLCIAVVVLPYYWTLWTPAFFALAALGVQALVASAPSASRVLFAALLLTVPATSAAAETHRVATLHAEGTAVLAGVLRAHGLRGPVVFAGVQSFEIYAYPPRPSLLLSGLSPLAVRAGAVVLGRPQCRTLIDPSVRALVALNLSAGRLRRVYSDSRIDVYGASGPLLLPSASQVAAQPPGSLADHC